MVVAGGAVADVVAALADGFDIDVVVPFGGVGLNVDQGEGAIAQFAQGSGAFGVVCVNNMQQRALLEVGELLFDLVGVLVWIGL